MKLRNEQIQILIEWWECINKGGNLFLNDIDNKLYRELKAHLEPEEEEIPFIAVGAKELDKNEDVGATIICKHCGNEHDIEYGTKTLEDGTEVPSKTLAFYKCDGIPYLAGINGKVL